MEQRQSKNTYLTDDLLSLSMLNTLEKIESLKKSEEDCCYWYLLNDEDRVNVERFVNAAYAYSGIDYEVGKLKMAAQERVEHFVGTYNFSKDDYRKFLGFYNDYLKYQRQLILMPFPMTDSFEQVDVLNELDENVAKLA